MFDKENLLPKRVTDQYQIPLHMWENRIKLWYADHQGMTKAEAELEYLRITQDLDMFGVAYYPIFVSYEIIHKIITFIIKIFTTK